MDDNNNNNGAQIIVENGKTLKKTLPSSNSSELLNKSNNSSIYGEFQSKNDSLKEKMSQYYQNYNENKNRNESNKNNHLQKMKLNKEEEKGQEISGNEIDKNELNIYKEKLIKEIELIRFIKNDLYKSCYQEDIFCDFKPDSKKKWQIGLINSINNDDNSLIITDERTNSKYKIKMNDFSRIAYFRKYSKTSNENFYNQRRSKKFLNISLENIQKIIKNNYFINQKNIYELYYTIHSKIYLGLDSAMIINTQGENEGFEESLRIILNILLFISQYYKYLLDNKEDFIYYENNIDNINKSEFIDLKIVDKKYAFFSFFDESLNILNKIFANNVNYLNWYIYFEKKLRKIIPSIEDEVIKPDLNPEYYPIYEEQKKHKSNNNKDNNKLLLKKICSDNAYKLRVTFTTDKVPIRSTFVCYFIDYFYALNGFNYLFQFSESVESIKIKLLIKLLNGINSALSLTGSYKDLFLSEKKILLRFVYTFIDKLNEKTITEYDKEDILCLIFKIIKLVCLNNDEQEKLIENMYFNYILKNLLLSKKLEQKISSLNILIDILKNIESNFNNKQYKKKYSDILIRQMTFQDFCVNCKNNQIMKIFLSEKSAHEEIIKRMQNIIFAMYKNNFGYLNKSDEEKVKMDKKMIFDTLFNKLRESDKNNEKVSKVHTMICNFAKILSEEDKFSVYEEIKKLFYHSIEKKGIPNKEELLFIINYTKEAISSKNNNEKESKEKNGKNIDNKNEESDGEEEEEDDEIIDNEDNSFSKNDDKLFSFVIEDKDYYGLNLIKNFLLEEEYKKYNMTNEQKTELITISIDGIIQIIENSQNKEKNLLLKSLYFKGIESIENSTDVVQFLILFNKIKNKSKNLSNKFIYILEEYSREYKLLTYLINDMVRYLNLIDSFNKKNNIELNINKKDMSEENKIYEGLFNNKLNIELRLELIIFLLQSETYDSDELIVKKLIDSCQTNILANNYLYKLLYKNINNFDEQFIKFLYDYILTLNKNNNINDIEYYKLCKEIIKKMNEIINTLCLMNNKDIAIINCECELQIKGLDILYNFLINTKNDIIRKDITDFIADIFVGIKFNQKEKVEIYWKNFAQNLYNKLDDLLKGNISENEQGIQGIISLIKEIEKKSTNKGEIIKDVRQILEEIKKIKEENKKHKNKKNNKKGQITCKEFNFSGNSGENGTSLNYDIKIDKTEYFYMLRYRLSNFFKIPLNTVTVVIDEDKYDKTIIKDKFKNIEFDLFNDYDNIYNLFNELEMELNDNNTGKKFPLIFKVKSKDNEQLKNIKNIIKNIPQLTKLLKQSNAKYILDVWLLVKDEAQNNNLNIYQKIKEILINKNMGNFNSIFNFENTNIYYISYILSILNGLINELNETDKNIINTFITNKIWTEKIKNIKIDCNNIQNIGEIYENNNIIKYLLNIFLIISQRTNDKNILIFILKKIIDFYYIIINQCITINLNTLSSIEGIKVKQIEDLYLENINFILGIINCNHIIIEIFIRILISKDGDEELNKIKYQFKYIFIEGLLKNKLFILNEKSQLFLLFLIDNEFLNKNDKENQKIKKIFIYFLLNFFLNDETFKKLIDYIKEISNNKKNDIYVNTEIIENNIKFFFDIITYIFEKNQILNNKYNFNNYISNILLPNIFNPIIEGVSLDLSFHEIIFGGNCKLLFSLLSSSNNYKLLISEEVETKLKVYLFNEIIMSKCNKNIYNENNIDNYKSISEFSEYSFKNAVNLFIFFLAQNMGIYGVDKEIHFYLDKLTELHEQSFWKNENTSSWKLTFKEESKISQFVGLKNLGCTCYINSLIQVFFNLIPFRESLLKCECKEEIKNSLYQLKKLFYCLKYLKKNYYSPVDFLENFDNQYINVHQQMDVDEFYINILDKIENRLRGTNNENLVKYFFQGIQNDLLTFLDGCTHHRTNANKFYSIQLPVKNKKNIYESLDTLTEKELMDGDNCIFCQKCNKKIPAMKSINFKSLPRILLFVLKRFEFNYNTMKKVKINDYYDFPFELDMTKYKGENNDVKNSDNNKYILKSIVVHMGNCENGHYYSFIKTNNEKWYEFNDTRVTPFDENLLDEETFGGDEKIYINGEEILREKNRNAYLLFYEKKDQSDCEQFNKIDAINSFLGIKNNNINDNKNNNNNNIIENGGIIVNEIRENSKNENISGMNNILSDINKEMFEYYLSKNLFSNEHQYFILELFLNILNYYNYYNLPKLIKHLCRNLTDRTNGVLREIPNIESNLDLYLNNKKLLLFEPNKKDSLTDTKNNISSQILDLFKHFIIYFYNIFLRTNEKMYLGCMVDLIKFFINIELSCADYLIEEFCNKNTIIEYLMNCPLYDIKKLIVGINYCAMAKSVKESEYSEIKEKQNKNINGENNIHKSLKQISEEDEELAIQLLMKETNNENNLFDNNNPLDYKNIPKHILKMIYNLLNIIRNTKYSHMNEYRFLFFTIYRFSLISDNTREFLIYKCRLFELLCLILHSNHKENDYNIKAIIESTYIGPYTVSHNILNQNRKEDLGIIIDKIGKYRNENYIYMLFFYLLSFTPSKENIKKRDIFDTGYSLENKNFISVLLNNIRTKQDTYCFINYIIEQSKSKTRVYNVYDALYDYFIKIDNNDKINYDYNNYNNFVNNNMNEEPNSNDPGLNPKYLIIIFKKFILSLLKKESYVKKGIKILFELFSINKKYYSYSIMIIDLILELFTTSLYSYRMHYYDELEKIKNWLEQWPISPIKYNIQGISMYKNMKINYIKLSEKEKNEFNDTEIIKTQQKIDKIYDIFSGKIKNENECEKDLELSDFKFIIGDVILYEGKERVIEEALDEELKISVDIDMKNNNKNGNNVNKRDIWIEIDNPTIEIKKLKEK